MNTYFTRARGERPDGRPVVADAPATIPPRTAHVLSHLAHLIDQSIEVRGDTPSTAAFAARALRVSRQDLSVERLRVERGEFALVGLAVAEAMVRFGATEIIGHDPMTPPEWRTVSKADPASRYPVNIHGLFDVGGLSERPVFLGLVSTWQGAYLVAYSARTDAGRARDAINDVLETARTLPSPFAGRTLWVDWSDEEPVIDVVAVAPQSREALILPDDLWEVIDLNVTAVFRSAGDLRAAGLAATRGVLLHGPPGTGKTGIIRTLASELFGDVTVFFPDWEVIVNGIAELYELAAGMAPSLVVLEDLERLLNGRGWSGREFLNALDGALGTRDAVVTIATANDIGEFDDAALRASRFDAIVEVPLPPQKGRRAIIERYLADIEADIDLARVVAATEGASGADLRELIALAVLHRARGRTFDTALLVELAIDRLGDNRNVGQYL